MGLGGGSNLDQGLQQTQQQIAGQEATLASQQAAQAAQFQQQDLATQASIAQLFASATGQTPAAQAQAKLKVMDFIHTSPMGLENQTFFTPAQGTTNPKTGVTAAPNQKQIAASKIQQTSTSATGRLGNL